MLFCEELDQLHYLLFSISMLYFTYVANNIQPFEITLRGLLFLLIVPNFILGYIAFVYNNFLALDPISSELSMVLLFVYLYILAYAFLENK